MLPILFSIFINDVTKVIHYFNCLLLADDIKLYKNNLYVIYLYGVRFKFYYLIILEVIKFTINFVILFFMETTKKIGYYII